MLAGANLVRPIWAWANMVGANVVDPGANLSKANVVRGQHDQAQCGQGQHGQQGKCCWQHGWGQFGPANMARANVVRANEGGANLVGAELVETNVDRANVFGQQCCGQCGRPIGDS